MNEIRLVEFRFTRHPLEEKGQQGRVIFSGDFGKNPGEGVGIIAPHAVGHLHAGQKDLHPRVGRPDLVDDGPEIFRHLPDRQPAQPVVAPEGDHDHFRRPARQHPLDPPPPSRGGIAAQPRIDNLVVPALSLDFLLQQRRVSLLRFQVVTGRNAVAENDHTPRFFRRRHPQGGNQTAKHDVNFPPHMTHQETTDRPAAKDETPEGPILSVHGLGKNYLSGGHPLTVLADIRFDLAAGAHCAIVGPSGSGKTTLLGLCAGLDRPDTGSVLLDGHNLNDLDEDSLAALRNATTGFVFQSFQLLPSLTARENVLVPLELRGVRRAGPAATESLERVGLSQRLDHYPNQLSGGEQQRVALARAFVHRPKILFADEPTGNLDDETSGPIVDLLFELNATAGTALVLVTHDPELARRAGRVITMRGGRILSDA